MTPISTFQRAQCLWTSGRCDLVSLKYHKDKRDKSYVRRFPLGIAFNNRLAKVSTVAKASALPIITERGKDVCSPRNVPRWRPTGQLHLSARRTRPYTLTFQSIFLREVANALVQHKADLRMSATSRLICFRCKLGKICIREQFTSTIPSNNGVQRCPRTPSSHISCDLSCEL
jgi:hypothetical protein